MYWYNENMRRKIIISVCLISYVLFITLPAVLHRYIYPNSGDDSATILNMFRFDNLMQLNHYGYAIIGYPLNWLASVTSIPLASLYLWFSYIALVGVGLSLFFILTKLVNYKAGLLALVIPTLLSRGFITLFDYGMIFNIISSGILLPFLIYFSIKYVITNRKVYLISSISLTFIYSIFHTMGIYLAPICLVMLMFYIIYKRKEVNNSIILFLDVVIITNLVGTILRIYPSRFSITNTDIPISQSLTNFYVYVLVLSLVILLFLYILRKNRIFKWLSYSLIVLMGCTLICEYLVMKPEASWIVNGVTSGSGKIMPIDWMLEIINPVTLIALFLSILLIWGLIKDLKTETKLLIFVYVLLSLMLATFALLGLTPTPDRMTFDLANMIGVLTAICVGLMWNYKKLHIIVVAIVVISFYSTSFGWCSYRNAVKPVDVETMEYLDTLNYSSYTCSPTINPDIYDQFTKAKYNKNSDVLIVRNLAMTPQSDPTSLAYNPHGQTSTEGFKLDKEFSETMRGIEIKIDIYIKE
jgi:hypothetical protein